MKPFSEYRVGQAGHELTLAVYRVTTGFPREELYGLVSQMRRSAASIPMNIAEGSARTDSEFRHFLTIALGSAAELEYQLLLARDLGYIDNLTFERLTNQTGSVKGMLVNFRQNAVRPANGQRPTANGPEADR